MTYVVRKNEVEVVNCRGDLMLTVIYTRNRMALKRIVCIIFVSFIRLAGGNNNVTLMPNGTANVFSGDKLTLECIYSGQYNPFSFNFYLNPDTSGLQIKKSTCVILISAGYDTSLYNHSCGTNSVSLEILMISQSNNGQVWECDVSFTTGDPIPLKDSTLIQVIATTTVLSTSASSSTATTITMTTTTSSVSATNTENTTSTAKTTSTEKTTSTGMVTQSIETTSSCPVPVLVITGISVSGFLSILLILIICCCCPCCCLYHGRKEEDTDKYKADLVETNDNGNPIPAYALTNVPDKSSNSAKFKEVQLDDGTLKETVHSNRLAANPTSSSNKDWADKPFPNKNEVIESEPVTTSL